MPSFTIRFRFRFQLPLYWDKRLSIRRKNFIHQKEIVIVSGGLFKNSCLNGVCTVG